MCPNDLCTTLQYLHTSGVARGGAGGGGRPPPLAETLPPLLPPQMKSHFVQRSMESRHFESRSAPPCSPLSPPCRPLILKSLATPLLHTLNIIKRSHWLNIPGCWFYSKGWFILNARQFKLFAHVQTTNWLNFGSHWQQVLFADVSKNHPKPGFLPLAKKTS